MLKTKDIKGYIVFLLISSMILSGFSFVFANSFSDIERHWAKNEIEAWVEKGLIEGYSDRTFRPDNNITRAEFITLINRAFGYTGEGIADFTDISSEDWFYGEIAKAKAAGYISGYPDGTIKPNNFISRQEVASVVVRILALEEDIKVAEKFVDYSKISDWSKGYIGAVLAADIMEGYPDGTFRAEDFIKRAEAVVTLERIIKTEPDIITYNKPGTYGPLEGIEIIDKDVCISTDGVVLQNVLIRGNLTLDKRIGEGKVILENVTIERNIFAYGGGENSVILHDCTLGGTVIVDKVNGRIRIIAAGTTSVPKIVLQTGAILLSEGDGLFSRVELPENLAKDAQITLIGNFGEMEVSARGASVKMGEESELESLTLTENAAGAKIDLDKGANIITVKVDAKVEIIGQGSIARAEINADGVLIEQKPEKTILKPGTKANVGGKDISEPKVPKGSDSSGDSGGSVTDPEGTAEE
ncbi:MAG TPA: S-layer homology domain-containing protein [Oscillospiraceae bacterium]|nr:S-layer homology domain-containing protein [Oscillospiraceae bacterium]